MSENDGMNGDQRQESRWPPLPALDRRVHKPATGRRAMYLGVASLAIIILAAAMTVFLSPSAKQMAALVFPETPTPVSWLATQRAALTPTGSDWFTYKNSDVGFQLDLPGVIGSSHSGFINDFSGKDDYFSYNGGPLSSPLQQREAQIWVNIRYSTRIVGQNICPQGGIPVKFGAGKVSFSAWQRDEGRMVALNLVLNGNAIEIDLGSDDPALLVLPGDGDIWQHMIASFALLPGAFPQTTHPCG